MKKIKQYYSRLPIFWKLIVGSSIIMILFIGFYNVVQGALVLHWFFEAKSKRLIDLLTLEDLFDSFEATIIISGLFGIGMSILGGVILSKVLLGDVKELLGTMKKINTKTLDERVPIKESQDEIAQLGQTFNHLMDELEESFHKQQCLVADVSHELKTPLTIIKGHLSLLSRWGKNDPEVLDKSLKASLEEVDRLILLVQNVLELSKIEDDQVKRGAETLQIVDVIEEVIADFRVIYPQIIFCQKGMTGCVITGSKEQLRQMLIILLDNAVKYTKEEPLPIEVTLSKQGNMVMIRIKDQGIGIAPEDLPYVFDRFYRGDKSRNSKQGSRGLGLAIAKKLVALYEGEIEIKSQLGVGTEVTITFLCEKRSH